MKVKYIGDYYKVSLIKDKIYDVLDIEDNVAYRIVDETGEDYLFNSKFFEIVEGSEEEFIKKGE